MRILLVEDDELLGDALKNGLSREGYTVDWLKDGHVAELALLTESFDIVVLDLGLPKRSGLEVLKSVRSKGVLIPIIILTAREALEDKVLGLDAGADDYVAKPFELKELYARIRALQRRAAGRAESVIHYQNITLDPASHSVYSDGKRVNISPREFTLLYKLLENAGRVLTREQLSQSLYGWDTEIDSNAVEVHVHNLRKKLGEDLIQTIRGVGYMIDRIA